MGGVGGSGGEMMSALKEGAPVPSEAKRRGRSVLGKPKTALPSGGKKQIWRKISVAESANIFFCGENKLHTPSGNK